MISFYNGQHAFYYMKAVYGTKTKHDREDGYKIACLVRGGNFPLESIRPSGGRRGICCLAVGTSSGAGPSF